MVETKPLWPINRGSSRPVAVCQSLTVRSLVPEASQRPSRLALTAYRPAARLVIVWSTLPVETLRRSINLLQHFGQCGAIMPKRRD